MIDHHLSAAAAKAGALQQHAISPGSLTGVVGLVNAHLLLYLRPLLKGFVSFVRLSCMMMVVD
jgi:hypothetical protein